MAHEFKVGDWVKVGRPYSAYPNLVGMVGTVVKTDKWSYAVEFDGWKEGHDGGFGDNADSRWHFHGRDLEPVVEDDDDEPADGQYVVVYTTARYSDERAALDEAKLIAKTNPGLHLIIARVVADVWSEEEKTITTRVEMV
jgi:hypothetical protein